DIAPDRQVLARYGMTVADLQDVIATAIGGETLTRIVQGRQRFPVVMRYGLDFRDSPASLGQILVPAPGGLQIPLASVARIQEVSGPTMINSEGGMLRGLVSLDARGRDLGGFMAAAKAALDRKLRLPPGYYTAWSGQYENEQRAAHTLQIAIPVALAIILLLLYFTFRSWAYALLVVLSVPFALVGGLIFQKVMNYDFSVAVAVGYLALAGIAVETGVVMLVYLEEAMDRQLALGNSDLAAIHAAAMEGAVLRLRPKLMTVAAALMGLVPLMWATGIGSDVMRPIATPMIGGLLTSMILVLLVLPVLFVWIKAAQLRSKGMLGSASVLPQGETY
ncbi:MAG: efflux RND transporter permease subunit, partial [Cyanobacteria bacterium REEB65]|nr:efflux RND transporter permease subunit [Cyanobacteria bacterium REEB65]